MSNRESRRRRRQTTAALREAGQVQGPISNTAIVLPLARPFEPEPPRYRIKRNGNPVEVAARRSDRGWALQNDDQEFAVAVATEIEKACEYFHVFNASYPFNPEFDVLTDEEVIERIRRLDEGEHIRETRRAQQPRFRLQKLPLEWKRALVANLDQLALEWGFEKVSNQPLAAQTEEKGGEI